MQISRDMLAIAFPCCPYLPLLWDFIACFAVQLNILSIASVSIFFLASSQQHSQNSQLIAVLESIRFLVLFKFDKFCLKSVSSESGIMGKIEMLSHSSMMLPIKKKILLKTSIRLL